MELALIVAIVHTDKLDAVWLAKVVERGIRLRLVWRPSYANETSPPDD